MAVTRIAIEILVTRLPVGHRSLELEVGLVVAVLLLERAVDHEEPGPGVNERIDLLGLADAARVRAERRLTVGAIRSQEHTRVEPWCIQRRRHALTSLKRKRVHNVVTVSAGTRAHRRITEALRRVRQKRRETLIGVERVHGNRVVTRVALLGILRRRSDPDRPAVEDTLVACRLIADLNLPRSLWTRAVERAQSVLALRVRVGERRVVVRQAHRVIVELIVDRHARAVRGHQLETEVTQLGVLHVRPHAHLRHVRVIRVHLDRLDHTLEVLDRRVHRARVLDHGAGTTHQLAGAVARVEPVEASIQDAALTITSVEAVDT